MTWMLGPQVAVWQKAGVANSSAVGLPDFSASSRLIWYIAGSTSLPDESRLRSGVSLTVGVLTAVAGWPTLGISDVALTSSRTLLVLGWGWPGSCACISTPQFPALSSVG